MSRLYASASTGAGGFTVIVELFACPKAPDLRPSTFEPAF